MPTDPLLTLVQWLSPSYPVGAFAYSHGLEAAVQEGEVADAADFGDWLAGVLEHGAGRSDAILLASAYGADADGLGELNTLARALAPSAGRLLETDQQGQAFSRTTTAIWNTKLPDLAYPVAVGAAAARLGVPLGETLRLFLHAFASNLTSAAMRLVPLGQTEGQRVLHGLAPLCGRLADDAQSLGPDDIGSCGFAADIASMRHETGYSRIFRS
jgi:urease accessory protein